ncbi:hypothetical protein BD779DRAFT_1747718 [Infundibulicybe gibba]|nr:hypothetical protein BD779DRAFT_1747718 [Infundibulicybe gibba]
MPSPTQASPPAPARRVTDHDGYDGLQITEGVYGLLRGALNFLRVEMIEDGDGEGENQNKGLRTTTIERCVTRGAAEPGYPRPPNPTDNPKSARSPPASVAPAPPPLQPALPVAPKAESPPEDSRFIIYISGPTMVAHEAVLVAHKVLQASGSGNCWNIGMTHAQLVMKCPVRGPVLCSPDMTIRECGASRGSRFAMGVSV